MGTYTIGQVAERSGFTASALRYYEQHGVIEPAGRTDAGYRLYDDASLARLGFVARAKQLGCTLEEITELAALWDDQECGPVQARLHQLVTTKIDEAQRRSGELVRLTAELQTAATHLGGDPVDGPCGEGCACVEPTGPGGGDGAAEPTTTDVPVALGQPAEPAVACTLPGDEVSGRVADWRHLLGFVRARQATVDGGLRLVLDDETPLDELARLVRAEQGCCSFVAFAITVDERGVALEVRAPADAADLVTAVFGAAA